MTFKKALAAYWKGNSPWYPIMIGFVIAFSVILGFAEAPLAIWILMGCIYTAIIVGTYFNVKNLRQILTQREKISDNKS